MNRTFLTLGIICLVLWGILFFISQTLSWLHPLTFFGVAFVILGIIWYKSPDYHIGHN
ncbi:hypothetical protein [uncultured Marixanthomonas sp.]|uniref:hypothetical protein n=1 Tax=uncultured Marixanthomonas sp. TaxID=757245 RepID=UPI0030D7E183